MDTWLVLMIVGCCVIGTMFELWTIASAIKAQHRYRARLVPVSASFSSRWNVEEAPGSVASRDERLENKMAGIAAVAAHDVRVVGAEMEAARATDRAETEHLRELVGAQRSKWWWVGHAVLLASVLLGAIVTLLTI